MESIRAHGRHDDDHDQDGFVHRRGGLKWQGVAWFLGVVVAGLVAYNAGQSQTTARIAVLEQRVTENDRRLGEQTDRLRRMEDKLDLLVARSLQQQAPARR